MPLLHHLLRLRPEAKRQERGELLQPVPGEGPAAGEVRHSTGVVCAPTGASPTTPAPVMGLLRQSGVLRGGGPDRGPAPPAGHRERGCEPVRGQLRHPSRAGGLPVWAARNTGSKTQRSTVAACSRTPTWTPRRARPWWGREDFVRAGFEAQRKSLVLVKNQGALPLPEKKKVYIPTRHVEEKKSFFRGVEPEKTVDPLDTALVEQYFTRGGDPAGGGFRPGGHRKPPHRRGLLPERRGGRRHRLRAHHPAVQALPGGHRPAAQPGRGATLGRASPTEATGGRWAPAPTKGTWTWS